MLFSAFDLSFLLVLLKVVIGLGKIDFWHISVSKQTRDHQVFILIFWYYSLTSKAAKNNSNLPSKVNIE